MIYTFTYDLMISYIVEILRGGQQIIESNKYTPVPADRHGITAKCSDTVHSKWKITEDVVKSIELKPHCKFKYYLLFIFSI